MFTREEDVEVSALRKQGWSISAIARHLGRDRKTVRAYLSEERIPGVRQRRRDPFATFEPYVRQRLGDDKHLQASVLLRELNELGFAASYQTLTREIRARGLRPRCEACARCGGVTIDIPHPPGEETQWDWLELADAPWGGDVTRLTGALSHSGKLRGVLADRKSTADLIAGVDAVARRLGGLTEVWRTDRIEGGVVPSTDRLVPAFADAAKHYGARVITCPPRRAQRKGVIEAGNKYLAQSWWRTARVADPFEAQRSLDRFCTDVADLRLRDDKTITELASTETLRPMPSPYPAAIAVARTVTWKALVHFEGNRYSVPASFAGGHVVVHTTLGAMQIEIRTLEGHVLVRHRRHPRGTGALVRPSEHRDELEKAVLQAFTTAPACRRKPNRPPSEAALAIAAEIRSPSGARSGSETRRVASDTGGSTRRFAAAVDLQRYAELVKR